MRSPAAAPAHPAEVERAIDTALARGVVYRALALGFAAPVESTAASLTASSGALEAAASLLDAQRVVAAPLLPAVRDFLDAAGAGAAVFAKAHARVFGHSAGPASPFETEYGSAGSFRQLQELADLAGTYRAFGLRAAAGGDERVDHVACECEFMGFLARKEAFLLAPNELSAVEAGEARQATTCAAADFLREHLGRFGRAFAARLINEDAGGPCAALGEALARMLGLECERLGVAAGPPTLELRMPEPDDAPMACGAACEERDGLIPLARRHRP